MSSNKRGSPMIVKNNEGIDKHYINELLEVVWKKLEERFTNISASFRYFDINSVSLKFLLNVLI
jgi:hypothetical protein